MLRAHALAWHAYDREFRHSQGGKVSRGIYLFEYINTTCMLLCFDVSIQTASRMISFLMEFLLEFVCATFLSICLQVYLLVFLLFL